VAQPSYNNQQNMNGTPRDNIEESSEDYQPDNYSYHSDHNYESPPVLASKQPQFQNYEEQKKPQPVKKEKPKIASELFFANEKSYDSHVTSNTDTWNQPENTQDQFEPESQDQVKYYGPPSNINMTTAQSPPSQNFQSQHQNFQAPNPPVSNYHPPTINTAEAEDFFSNLGLAPPQTPQTHQTHHFEQPVEQPVQVPKQVHKPRPE
jgi:hypothetical protein